MEGGGGLLCGVWGGWGRSAPGKQESWTREGVWSPLPVPPTLSSVTALGSAPRPFLCWPSSPVTGAHPPHHGGPSSPSWGPILPAVTGGPSSPSWGPILPAVTGGPSSPSWGPILPVTGPALSPWWPASCCFCWSLTKSTGLLWAGHMDQVLRLSRGKASTDGGAGPWRL